MFGVIVAVGGVTLLGFTGNTEVPGESVAGAREEETVPPDVGETQDPALPGASAVPSADDRAAAYLRKLRTSVLTTYVHPDGASSLRYPRVFDLLTNSGGDEQFVNVLHPNLPLEIWIAVYPQGRYALDLPEDYETYAWPAPAGAEHEAVVFLEQDETFSGGYRGVIWFDARGKTFEIRRHAPEPGLLVEWMDQVISSDLTIATSASSPH
jgi:hypothetical protein